MKSKLAILTIGLLAATSQIVTAEENFEKACNEVADHYATLVHATYGDTLAEAKTLQKAVDEFLAAPSAKKMEAAKEQWIKSRQPYLQTEVFRFYGGPIDNDNGPEPFINGWPMDESYVDYVVGSDKTGIIGDTKSFPEITIELVESMNEKGGETLISTGYHAIEFLLWGQDLSESGPGERPFTDYTTRANAARRGAYLKATADLLVKHFEMLTAAWAPENAGNYRAKFLAEPPKTKVHNILYGAKILAGVELGGERLLVAWDTQSQEDEHSCFSDTTHQDVLYDAMGISNVFTGQYVKLDGTSVSGPGLNNIVGLLFDEESADKLEENIAAMTAAVNEIPKPFDQAILGERNSPERQKILKTVEILEDQATIWADLERKLLAK